MIYCEKWDEAREAGKLGRQEAGRQKGWEARSENHIRDERVKVKGERSFEL